MSPRNALIVAVVLSAAIAASPPPAAPPPVAAAAPTACAYCNYTGITDKHSFSSECTSGGGCRDCADAPEGHIGCHSTSDPGECGPSGHGACDTEDPEGEELALAALRAGVGDGGSGVLADRSRTVLLNVERQALQWADCRGGVVYHLALPSASFEAVMAASSASGTPQ